jgi:hypothetical protein
VTVPSDPEGTSEESFSIKNAIKGWVFEFLK